MIVIAGLLISMNVTIKTLTGEVMPSSIRNGQTIFTQKSITLFTETGDRIKLGANTQVTFEETGKNMVLNLEKGKVRAVVKKAADRKFLIKTPVAVASVRGTDLTVDADRKSIKCNRGAVEVIKDESVIELNKNEAFEVENNEKVKAEKEAFYTPDELNTIREVQASEHARLMEMKENEREATAIEYKQGEYVAGKTLIDVHGNRVRLEAYVKRPAQNQFEILQISRRQTRTDSGKFTAKFRDTDILPEDLHEINRIMLESLNDANNQPKLWPKEFITTLSNGQDNFENKTKFGDPIQSSWQTAFGIINTWVPKYMVNTLRVYGKQNNGTEYNNIKEAFYLGFDNDDNGTNTGPRDTKGYIYFAVLDYTGLGYKAKWSDIGELDSIEITNSNGSNLVLHGGWYPDPNTGNLIPNPDRPWDKDASLPTFNFTLPSGYNMAHYKLSRDYRDNTNITVENFIIDDYGKIYSWGALIDTTMQNKMTNDGDDSGILKKAKSINFETIVTATEFEGRNIDVIIDPDLLKKEKNSSAPESPTKPAI